MIAPTNFTEELDLYLYVSVRVQNHFSQLYLPRISDDFDSLICEFEAAFLGSLKAQSLMLPANVSTHTRLIGGNPRRLVGTMK